MTRRLTIATTTSAALLLAAALVGTMMPAPLAAADPVEPGRFVWHDLLTRDVAAAKRFYGELLGWQFEDTSRGDKPYVVAHSGSIPLAGIVDITDRPNAGPQWLSYMAVANVDQSIAQAQTFGGKVLVAAQNFPIARAAVLADPQGAPFGIAQARRPVPETDPMPRQIFWNEYLARDGSQALDFYKRFAGFESAVSDTKLGVDYHVLRKSRPRAGLFQLPASASDIQSNWLPYVLVDDPSAVAARATTLGGRILLPAAPERRNNTLVVIADPGGAPLALQKFPF